MTPRENAQAILDGRQPERYVDFMHAVDLMPDPVFDTDNPPQDGVEHLDAWGTTRIWRIGEPGQMPIVNDDNAVIKDIEDWQSQVTVPDPEALDWGYAEAYAKAVDREQKFACCFSPAGLFERTHYLMGFENALMAYLTNPDEMAALLRVIADYKIRYIHAAARHLHPEVIFFHDDWGSKQNVFLPPRVWRELIKPLQREIVQAAHDCGMLFMHHADCICQPLAEDMVEIGIDIWQGAIPQNDIVEIQRITGGRLAMVGGVDGPKIDVPTATEADIRAEVRRAIDTYCPGGRFFPGIANGVCYIEKNNEIYLDELYRYGTQWAQEHPVG